MDSKGDVAKKALVTGGNQGIGKGIVRCLAENGYDVAFTYYSAKAEADKISSVVKGKYGRICIVYQADFTIKGKAEEIVKKAYEDMGGLDLLVNNAAVLEKTGCLYDADIDLIDTHINANFRAYVLAMREAARIMMKNGVRGNIINITSHRAERPFPGDSVYGGIKAAINRVTQSLALEVAPYGIRANCVEPGAIEIRTREEYMRKGTPMADIEDREILGTKVPLGRIGQPEDIGNAVVWLASEKASYVTGIWLRVDGGLCLPGMPEKRRENGESDLGWGYVREKTENDMKNW